MASLCNTRLLSNFLLLLSVLPHHVKGQTSDFTTTSVITSTSSFTTVTPMSATPLPSSMFSTVPMTEPTPPDATTTSGSGNDSDATTFDTGSGGGVTEVTTIISDATNSFDSGSGSNTTDTTTSFEDGSGSGSDAATSSGNTTITTPIFETTPMFEGSGGADETTAANVTDAMTTAEVGSGITDDATTQEETSVANTTFNAFFNETTIFEVTTGAVVLETGLPWYIIVIICLGILILILLIVSIVVCCLYKSTDKVPVKKEPAITTGGSTETTQGIKLQPMPGYVPQAPTIKPVPKKEEKAVTNFVSSTPMTPPVGFADPSAVRKREKAKPRIESRPPSFEEDEGFNEPLVKRKQEMPMKKVPKRRPVPVKAPDPQYEESDRELSERAPPPQYRQYYLPTPVQTALASKGLGDSLTDDALAARHALQRSDIERHRNKQRLRRQQSAGCKNDAYEHDRRNINAVLAPAPPTALQGIAQRKRIRMKNVRNSEMRHMIPEKEGRYRKNTDDTDNSEAPSEKPPAHEVVIAKMAKLLEEAYALLAPTVQKNLVKPAFSQPGTYQFPSPPSGPAPPIPVIPPPPTAGYSQPVPPGERLFTRTQTPPTALLPPQATPEGYTMPKYVGQLPARANDANSVVWTPYRTYDQLAELQREDPSLSIPLGPNPPRTSIAPQRSMPNSEISIPKKSHGTVPNITSESVPNPNGFYYPMTQSVSRTPIQSDYKFSTKPVPNPNTPVEYYPMIPGSSSSPLEQPNVPSPKNVQNDRPSQENHRSPNLEGGVEEPASSLVQSIKDTLAKLAGTATHVTEIESSC